MGQDDSPHRSDPYRRPDPFYVETSTPAGGPTLNRGIENLSGMTCWQMSALSLKTDNSLNEGFAPQWHHIFPRSKLKKAGRDDADINALANITVINEKTNEHKLAAHLPEDYIQKFAISDDALACHFVPTELRPFSIERYDAFVTRRAEHLAASVNNYFRSLG